MRPVVGDKVFTRESGLVVAQMLSYPPSVEGYAPEAVGRQRQVALGKKSGKMSIEYGLEKLGLKLPDTCTETLLKEVKQLSIAKKDTVTMEEFKELAEKLL
jgi:isopropylmalate/homocitrate/citramalate synthase